MKTVRDLLNELDVGAGWASISPAFTAFVVRVNRLWKERGVVARDTYDVDAATELDDTEYALLLEEGRQLIRQAPYCGHALQRGMRHFVAKAEHRRQIDLTFGEGVALEHGLRFGLQLIQGKPLMPPEYQEVAAAFVVLASELTGQPMEFPAALDLVLNNAGVRKLSPEQLRLTAAAKRRRWRAPGSLRTTREESPSGQPTSEPLPP